MNSNDNENKVKVDVTSDDESVQPKLENNSIVKKRRLSTISLADIDGNAVEIVTNIKDKNGNL